MVSLIALHVLPRLSYKYLISHVKFLWLFRVCIRWPQQCKKMFEIALDQCQRSHKSFSNAIKRKFTYTNFCVHQRRHGFSFYSLPFRSTKRRMASCQIQKSRREQFHNSTHRLLLSTGGNWWPFGHQERESIKETHRVKVPLPPKGWH